MRNGVLQPDLQIFGPPGLWVSAVLKDFAVLPRHWLKLGTSPSLNFFKVNVLG